MEARANYIDGRWVDSPQVIQDVNPSRTGDVIGEYASAEGAHVGEAIAAARAALPRWRGASIQERAAVLDAAGHELLARRGGAGHVAVVGGGQDPGGGHRGGGPRRAHLHLLRRRGRPHGGRLDPVRAPRRRGAGAAGAHRRGRGHHPMELPHRHPSWKIAPALAFGNTVVFKPAQLTPGCAWELAVILDRAGVPPGVFNLVVGPGSTVGEAFVPSPDVDAITFTGSVEVGKDVASRAVARLAKIQLEMGGKNPLVVLDDADLDQAVECAVQGAYYAYYSTGQRCTASSRLIVTSSIHDAFVDRLQERIAGLKVGNALGSGTDIGPVVDRSQLEQDLHYIEVGTSEGARLACGGRALGSAGVDYHVPSGGAKGSGYGPKEQGTYAEDFFTAVKVAYVAPPEG